MKTKQTYNGNPTQRGGVITSTTLPGDKTVTASKKTPELDTNALFAKLGALSENPGAVAGNPQRRRKSRRKSRGKSRRKSQKRHTKRKRRTKRKLRKRRTKRKSRGGGHGVSQTVARASQYLWRNSPPEKSALPPSIEQLLHEGFVEAPLTSDLGKHVNEIKKILKIMKPKPNTDQAEQMDDNFRTFEEKILLPKSDKKKAIADLLEGLRHTDSSEEERKKDKKRKDQRRASQEAQDIAQRPSLAAEEKMRNTYKQIMEKKEENLKAVVEGEKKRKELLSKNIREAHQTKTDKVDERSPLLGGLKE